MTGNASEFEAVLSFVEGRMEPLAFEAVLQSSPALERLFVDAAPIPPYSSVTSSLFLYLIALDYADVGDIVNAQDALARWLGNQGIASKPAPGPGERFDLLLAAQPKWLAVDPARLAPMLAEAPEMPKSELERWLRARILEQFRCAGKPPHWLQAPAWPIGANGPLVFLGQIPLPDYFHDEAAAYVFHDPTAGTFNTVVQVA